MSQRREVAYKCFLTNTKDWNENKRKRGSRLLFILNELLPFPFLLEEVEANRLLFLSFFCSPPFHNSYLSKAPKKNWVSCLFCLQTSHKRKEKVKSLLMSTAKTIGPAPHITYFCLYELLSVSGRQTRYTYTILWRWTLLLNGLLYVDLIYLISTNV